MARGLLVAVAVLFAIVDHVVSQPPIRKRDPVPEVTQDCLECICQGSSNCDTSLRCHNAGGDAYFCGPYVISWAYWHDGGRPGDKGRAHDFETCLSNKTCAERAVKGYMKKHGRDCDLDGAISCYDFARIHKMGPGACGAESIQDSDYWEKFLVCYEGDDVRRYDSVYDYAQPAAEQAFPEFPGGNLDARTG